MPDGQLPQIEAAGWSREALDEAIDKGSLDHVLYWIGTEQTSAIAGEDAASVDQASISTTKACDILIERASEPLVIRGISSVLSRPVKSRDDFFTVCAGLDGIVSYLPLAALRLYRPGLEILATSTAESPPGVSLPSLTNRAKDAVKFIDFPHLTWAPQHKTDFMGERSLEERVHTAHQMRPHARELLDWLADCNWPPRSGCIKQLARFPEVAVDPIKEIVAGNRNDPEWLLHLVEFVEENVPIGVLWEKLEPELKLLASSEAEDEENRDLADAAQRLLGLLKEWQEEQGRND